MGLLNGVKIIPDCRACSHLTAVYVPSGAAVSFVTLITGASKSWPLDHKARFAG
jgi:hypothetical protein